MAIKIYTFTVGPFYENTYLLENEGRGLLIDPGFSSNEEFDGFATLLDSQSITLDAVLLTHAHVDHVLGLQKVRSHFEVPVFLSEIDGYLWHNFTSQAALFGFEAEPFNFNPENLPIQTQWQIGQFTFDVFHTPGHAPAHIVLYNLENKFLIAGDTLFKEGIGRTDLYKGNFEQLEKSIKEKLFTLPGETIVYPGHGPITTIGHEKVFNPFLKGE